MKIDANDFARECGPGALRDRLLKIATNPRLKVVTPRADDVDGAPILTTLADIPPQSVRWLWPGRIPLGKLTVLCGDPGLGKSFVTMDIAARISSGHAFPDSSQTANAGRVIILNAEDDAADTIRPRLDRLQADVSKIILLDGVKSKDGKKYFSLREDLTALAFALQTHPDTRLVIIDPISAYFGRIDSHNNAEVRGVLAPLSELAARYGVAFILINHLNKGNGGLARAIYRGTGSLGINAAARAVWQFHKDKDDDKRRLMLPVKINVAQEVTGLAYRLVDGEVQWESEPVNMTADEGMAAEFSQKVTKSDAAGEWLRRRLESGPVDVAELKNDCVAAGFSWSTLGRVKDEVGIESIKHGFGNTGRWQWKLK